MRRATAAAAAAAAAGGGLAATTTPTSADTATAHTASAAAATTAPFVRTPRPLRNRRMSSGRRMLLEPFEITVTAQGHTQTWHVPPGFFSTGGGGDHDNGVAATYGVGFTTDYSSIPTCLSWVADWDQVDVAGVIHDYLYSAPKPPADRVSRERADHVWRVVAEDGVSNALASGKAGLAYRALRWFGGRNYHTDVHAKVDERAREAAAWRAAWDSANAAVNDWARGVDPSTPQLEDAFRLREDSAKHGRVAFLTPLDVERRDDGQRVLLRPFVVEVNGRRVVIPADATDPRAPLTAATERPYQCNFDSLPKKFDWVVDWRKVDVASLVHNFLYHSPNVAISRSEADAVWWRLAIAGKKGLNRLQAYLCWRHLRRDSRTRDKWVDGPSRPRD